jgi:HD-GYP domain-containing protein (c-di-GMP phosphodiesterase class II)
MDGTGYPQRLKGEEIPLGSRMITIADSYDALTTNRPYRTALTREEALAELERCSGAQFDPKVLHAFRAVLERAQ